MIWVSESPSLPSLRVSESWSLRVLSKAKRPRGPETQRRRDPEALKNIKKSDLNNRLSHWQKSENSENGKLRRSSFQSVSLDSKALYNNSGKIKLLVFIYTIYCISKYKNVIVELSYMYKQGGRTWQAFGGGKNGHETFRQARIYNFRDKCVVFARNLKFSNLTQ